MAKMNFAFLFSKEEKENWSDIINRVRQTVWWKQLENAVEKGNEEVDEQTLLEAARFMENLLKEFTVNPLGSRLLPSQLLPDFLTKHVLQTTGQSAEAFYEAGREIKEAIISGDTYLLLPTSLFESNKLDELILKSLASSLVINAESLKSMATIGSYVTPVMHLAAEDNDFAEILFRYGIAEMEDDNTFIIHFERLLASFGDLNFVEEVIPYVTQGIPMELLWGKQSTFSFAFSASLANAILCAGLVAKINNREESFLKDVKIIGEKLKTLDDYMKKETDPDWDEISHLCQEIMNVVSKEITKVKKGEALIWKLTDEAHRRGVYPDLVIETLLLTYKVPVSQKIWDWLYITQKISLKIVEQTTSLQRQPVYWLALLLLRIGTEADTIDEVIRSLQKKVISEA